MSNQSIRTLVHDARNPLNRICMQAELAIMLADKDTSSVKLKNALSIIIEACQECDESLNKISEINKSGL